MIAMAILHFTHPTEEAVYTSRFFKSLHDIDLSSKEVAAYLAGIFVEQAIKEQLITAEYTCAYLGLRELLYSEVLQLLADTAPSAAPEDSAAS